MTVIRNRRRCLVWVGVMVASWLVLAFFVAAAALVIQGRL